ncbi:MAG: hypothetical protein GVY20_16680, partial [Bacteroidetes bacterium]|nr:hypothetical protein [Bacteroidota bacterium]
MSCYVIQSYSDIECDGGITSYANGQNGSATSRIRPTTFGPEAPGKETAMQTEEPDTPGSKTLKPGSKDPDTELAQKIKN